MNKRLWLIPFIIGLPAVLFVIISAYGHILFGHETTPDKFIYAVCIAVLSLFATLMTYDIGRSRL